MLIGVKIGVTKRIFLNLYHYNQYVIFFKRSPPRTPLTLKTGCFLPFLRIDLQVEFYILQNRRISFPLYPILTRTKLTGLRRRGWTRSMPCEVSPLRAGNVTTWVRKRH